MVMGDVLAVMDRGRWEQVDAPERIFHAPATRFVATFMGIADFLPARLDNGALLTELGSAVAPEGLTAETRAEVMVRPDDVTIRPDESGSGVILERTFQGSFYLYRVALPSGNVVHCLEPHTEEHAVGLRVDVRFNGSHPPLCFVDGRRLGLDHNGARS